MPSRKQAHRRVTEGEGRKVAQGHDNQHDPEQLHSLPGKSRPSYQLGSQEGKHERRRNKQKNTPSRKVHIMKRHQ